MDNLAGLTSADAADLYALAYLTVTVDLIETIIDRRPAPLDLGALRRTRIETDIDWSE